MLTYTDWLFIQKLFVFFKEQNQHPSVSCHSNQIRAQLPLDKKTTVSTSENNECSEQIMGQLPHEKDSTTLPTSKDNSECSDQAKLQQTPAKDTSILKSEGNAECFEQNDLTEDGSDCSEVSTVQSINSMLL